MSRNPDLTLFIHTLLQVTMKNPIDRQTVNMI